MNPPKSPKGSVTLPVKAAALLLPYAAFTMLLRNRGRNSKKAKSTDA